MNCSSLPAVGRYIAVWMEGIVPGNLRSMDWKLGESLGRTVMKGEREECHMTMVPP